MESARLKNIAIIILLLLNAVLLSLVALRRVQETRAVAAARRDAAEVIRAAGIELSGDVLPDRMKLQPMAAARDVAAEERVAKKLLGRAAEQEAPGGGVYRWRGENGSIQFHSTGEFSARFTADAIAAAEGQTPEEHAAQLLRALGFEAELTRSGAADGTGSVTFRQTLSGVNLIGCRMTLHYSGGTLTGISDARWLIGSPVKRGQAAFADPATVLMGIYHGLTAQDEPCGAIERIVPAYEYSADLSGGARLSPVWYVRTDTQTYLLDAQATALKRVTDQ